MPGRRDMDEISMLNQVFDYIVSADAVGDAKRFMAVISEALAQDPELEKQDLSLFQAYSRYLIAAKYVALFDLDETEIERLLKENFDFVLNNPDYDLNAKIRFKVRSIRDLDERDAFKNKVREAMLKCRARLGGKKLIINGAEHEPTVANWLKDYYIKVGIEKADSLKINEYLVNNDNIKLLSSPERTQLKKIFIFFESLKISSVESPTLEENFGAILPDGKLAMATEGKLEKIDENILKIYQEVSGVIKEREVTLMSPNQNYSGALSSGENIKKSVSSFATFSITDLETALKNYSPASLEYKVIKEEINRLNKAENKKTG